MLTGLRDAAGGSEVLPFVPMFYGTPSENLSEDDDGEVHKIAQGEGGEQGDPMMPLLYSLGQHRVLEAIDREMGANQHLMAFLDDIFFVTMPREVGEVFAVVQEKMWIHSCIRVHVGKTRAHNAGLWQCLSSILHIDPAQCEERVRDADCMPLSLGGVGSRSALRTRAPAFWASWSDCLPMIQARNPDVAAALVNELEGFPLTPVLGEAASIARELVGIQGFEPPSWRALAAGERPPDREPEV